MKKVYSVFGFFVMLFLVVWLASPYWMLYQINQAIDQNQPEKIEKYIDFPRVQASLEPQIQQKVQQKLAGENHSTWWGGVSEHVSHQVAEHVVQMLLTPESIALLLQGKAFKDAIHLPKLSVKNVLLQEVIALEKPTSNQLLAVNNEQNSTSFSHDYVETQYLSLNTFQVIVPIFSSGKTKFIFQRQYIKWQLTGIYFT